VLESEKEKKRRTWLEAAKTLLSLAHRNLSWCTGQCPVRQAGLWRLATLGKLWRRTAIIHRTVRWCTGLSGEPMAASATVDRAIRARRVAHANGRLGAPDCPVCTGQCPVRQPARRSNGRLRQEWKEIRTGHEQWMSGGAPDCPVRHPTEGKNCLSRMLPTAPSCLGAIKRDP
jgi:heterodisulfide reductase subunit C